MRLEKYLESTGESVRGFAGRAGVSEGSLRRFLALDGALSLETMDLVVAASRARPAHDGATVTIEDLLEQGREALRGGDRAS